METKPLKLNLLFREIRGCKNHHDTYIPERMSVFRDRMSFSYVASLKIQYSSLVSEETPQSFQ